MDGISSKPSTINVQNEIEFTDYEYYILYNFFVTYSLCNNQSKKQRKLSDYGCKKNKVFKEGIKNNIVFEKGTFDVSKNETLVSVELVNYDLTDNKIFDLTWERGLFAYIDNENDPLNIMFYYIRNSLAHGDYVIKRNNSNEKVLIMQSSLGKSIRARTVIKLETILNIIKIIDNNKIIIKE